MRKMEVKRKIKGRGEGKRRLKEIKNNKVFMIFCITNIHNIMV